jgi:molybdate transport system substrate-binding protein
MSEIRFFCAEALRPAMAPLLLRFRETGSSSVVVDYANVGTITSRLRKGEVADLAIVSPEQWQQLGEEKVLMPDRRTALAHIGIAVAIRRGTLKPDVETIATLKRALLGSRSIAIVDPARGSPSGVRAIKLFDRLGIAAEVRARVKLVDASEKVFEALVDGEADLGINQASEVLAHPLIDSAGTLPEAVRFHTEFVAGIPVNAVQPQEATRLVEFLLSAQSAALFQAKGIGVGPAI